MVIENKDARTSMVAGQILPNKVNDPKIIAAIANIPRENFLPKALRGVAYVDQAVEVATGRYLMEPMTLARLLTAAHIKSTDLVLVVGCASGYEAAIIGKCADAVVALEQDQELLERANKDLLDIGCDNVAVVAGELLEGVPKQGPYNLIFINGAVGFVPDSLIRQLSDGGRLLCIKEADGVFHGTLITKQGATLLEKKLFETNGAILDDFKQADRFVFA